MLETAELQREALNTPVDKRFIKTSSAIKGPYTSGDYVRWKLNQIFGPDHWSHTIIQGPELITINEKNAYMRVTIRLAVKFADGEQVVHDDVGIWPLSGSRDRTTGERNVLENEAPERYETIEKAVITDGIKACCEYLGICFRPVADEALDREVQKTFQPAKPTEISKRKATDEESRKGKTTATDFWERFNQLIKEAGVEIDRKAPEILQAQKSGEWDKALDWLNKRLG